MIFDYYIRLYLFFHSMKDFFTRYRESRHHPYILPGVFGLLFWFAIVAQMTGTPIDLGSLQANVVSSQNPKVLYDADLILERTAETITLRIGKDAQNVDTLYGTILWDPTYFQGLSTTQNGVEIVHNEPGVYLIKISLGRSLQAGESLVSLTPQITWATPLALLDAGFQSAGMSYSLSVKN